MKLFRNRLNQTGDTVVEVLIAIAIIGSVLAGAYATSNASLTNVRAAQEHQEATSLAESQADSLGNAKTASLPPQGTAFCFDTNGAIVSPANASCQSRGTERIFDVKIAQPNPSPTSPNLPTYTISVTWLRLGGGTDEVQVFYQPESN